MITVYSKPRCKECMYTKMFLDQNKIEYENVDIEANPGAFELIKHYGFTSLPVVVIDDEIGDSSKSWSGFQIDKLERLIE